MSVAPATTLPLSGSRAGAGRAGGWLAGVLLVIVCLAVYLPGFVALPPVDRDESRFAQASRQMGESGDLVIPRVLGKPRLNKPPLIYWLQSASAAAFTGGDFSRDAIWMYRVPSLLGAILAVLLTWRLGCALFDPRAALLAGVVLAICPVIAWEARQARADMVLVALCVGATWALWRVLKRASIARAMLLWVVVGLGVLIKGPVTPMIVLLTIAGLCLLERSLRPLARARPLLGLGVVCLMVLPWVILVALRVGLGEYAAIVFDETLGRSLEPKEGHAGPPGYHAVLAIAIFFPGSLWIVAGVGRALRLGLAIPREGSRWRRLCGVRAAHGPEAFLLCALVPAWVVFELVSTKLPHYTMPLLPVLALLAARAALGSGSLSMAWLRLAWVAHGVRAWVVLGVGLGASVGMLGWLAVTEGRAWGWIVIAIAAAASLAFAIGGVGLVSRRDYSTLLFRGVWLCVALLILIGVTLPRVQAPWVVKRLVDIAASVGPDRPLVFVVLHEDSAVFLTRGTAQWVDPVDLDDWLGANPGGLVVVPDSLLVQQVLHEHARVSGFNYPKGKAGTWLLAERAP
ncbi:MAG: glycosyltransferase family 39 protein [Phycisphaerales bacterium]|nr:glycosyltransferase family 39 protein [Phycisphaerales bacterium]